jgi:hypothetical protein
VRRPSLFVGASIKYINIPAYPTVDDAIFIYPSVWVRLFVFARVSGLVCDCRF